MDANEFLHWVARNDIDPISEERADLRAGTVAAMIGNCLTSKHDWKPSDFVPQYGAPAAEEMTEEELYLNGLKIACMFGGEVRKA